nr:PREDICTED: uncharacterized protein LOC105663504 [Megachile rotundata]
MSETRRTVCRDMQDIAQNCDPSRSVQRQGYRAVVRERVKLDTYPRAPPPTPHPRTDSNTDRDGEQRPSVLSARASTVPPKYVIISTGDTSIPRPREEFDQNVSRYSHGMPGELRASPCYPCAFLRLLRPPHFTPCTLVCSNGIRCGIGISMFRVFMRQNTLARISTC